MIDFFACQGGASKGFADAGFKVISVDKMAQPRFAPGGLLLLADAIADFRKLLRDYRPRAVAGSPPCQDYTDCQRIQKRQHPRLIEPFRELCEESGLPYVIENVEGARPELKNPITLCGASFGLHTYRHRLFESNVDLTAPRHPEHRAHSVKMGRPLREGDWYHAVGNFNGGPKDERKVGYVKRDMGVEWMTRDGVRECIPPVYAEFVGRQLMQAI